MNKISIIFLILGCIIGSISLVPIISSFENQTIDRYQTKRTEEWYQCANQTDPINKSLCYEFYEMDWGDTLEKENYIRTIANPLIKMYLSFLIAIVFALICFWDVDRNDDRYTVLNVITGLIAIVLLFCCIYFMLSFNKIWSY